MEPLQGRLVVNAGLPLAAWQRHKVANSWGEVAAISVVPETLEEDAERRPSADVKWATSVLESVEAILEEDI